jgi:hypothetical protein
MENETYDKWGAVTSVYVAMCKQMNFLEAICDYESKPAELVKIFRHLQKDLDELGSLAETHSR